MTSQIERVAKVFQKNPGKNLSAERIATSAKVSLDSVYRRVYDLRNRGTRITTSAKTVKGVRKQFYCAA
jgi:biotin operon repressor